MTDAQDSQFQWFEFETRMRKLIKDVMITYDKQMRDDEKRIIMIEKEMTENETRLKEIEFLLYKSEDKESRFDELHKIISIMESERRKDINILKSEQEDFQKRISEKVFVYDTKLKQIDSFEQMLNQAIVDYEKIDTMMKDHKQQVMEEITTNLDQQNEILKVKSEEISLATAKIIKMEPKLVYFNQEILKLEQVDMKQSETLDKLKLQIQELKDTKLDQKFHVEFKQQLEDRLQALTENYGAQIDRMLNNENYVEKYAPIYTQRMINDTLEQILKKKQKKKLIKYNEIKMPLLLQPIFDDLGIPNLLTIQRQFHNQIMKGLISEQQKMVKNSMVDEKERTKAKWQIQNKMPPIAQLQSVQDYTPIQSYVQQRRQSSNKRLINPNLNRPSDTNMTPINNGQNVNFSQFSAMQQKSPLPKRDTLENPMRSDYSGPYRINDPKIINISDSNKHRTDVELKAQLLSELYQNEDDSHTDKDDLHEGINDEDDDDDDHDDSFDFEQQLKKEVSNMVAEKLENFERRLKYLIEQHEGNCKDEFKMYESHIKEQVKKMTAYVQEVHANHIAEINNFKKEKNEQILVNQMLVKKVQSVEQWRNQQQMLNEQYQQFGHCLENFVSIFKAIEMADNTFVMNVDNQHEEVVLNQANKELSSAKKNAFTTPNLHERSVSQTSNYNLGAQMEGRDFQLQTQSGINHPTNFMNVKKLITDKNQKLFNERKRNYGINIISHSGENHQIMRNELVNEYMKIEQLVEEAINNINLIKEGDHVKIVKKNIFQISKTRQPSPTRSEDELLINKAMDQKLNGSILVQGTGPGVLGPISYTKIKKHNFKEAKSQLNQTFTHSGLGNIFSAKRQSQNLSKLYKKGGKNLSRIEETEQNHHYHTLSGMTPTQISLAKNSHVQYTHLTLEDSSVQMPTISNSIYNPNSSIMVHDLHNKTSFQLHSNLKGDKTGFPLIQTKKIE
eukprot:403370885